MTAPQAPLPCPFCGGQAHAGYDAGTDDQGWCGCADINCVGWAAATQYRAQEHAIAAWNRRAAGRASRETVEAVAAVIAPSAWPPLPDDTTAQINRRARSLRRATAALAAAGIEIEEA